VGQIQRFPHHHYFVCGWIERLLKKQRRRFEKMKLWSTAWKDTFCTTTVTCQNGNLLQNIFFRILMKVLVRKWNLFEIRVRNLVSSSSSIVSKQILFFYYMVERIQTRLLSTIVTINWKSSSCSICSKIWIWITVE